MLPEATLLLEPENLSKLTSVIVEMQVDLFGHGFQFQFGLIHLRRQRFDVAACRNSPHATHHLLAFF